MIRRFAPPVGALILLVMSFSSLVAQPDRAELGRTLERFIREQGFSTVRRQVERDGTMLGLPPAALVGPLAAPENGLSARERETILLVLLHVQTDAESRARVSAELVSRSSELDDWTLLATIAEDASRAGVLEFGVLAGLADRVMRALETPGEAGYERLALSLATTAADPMLLRRTLVGEGADVTPPGMLALAETFRTIARLSRSRGVVNASVRAARRLVGASSSY